MNKISKKNRRYVWSADDFITISKNKNSKRKPKKKGNK